MWAAFAFVALCLIPFLAMVYVEARQRRADGLGPLGEEVDDGPEICSDP